MTGSDPHRRPLAGLSLGLSISECEDGPGLGFTSREVSRTVREISRAVLAQGGRVVFGHDWREGGVMETVLRIAIDYHDGAGAVAGGAAAMTNFVPWPDRSTLSPEDKQRYHGVLEIVEANRPEVPAGVTLPHGPEAEPVLRVLALTEMRQRMADYCDARLCIGGRVAGFQGRGAGVFEEAAVTVDAGKPLFVSGLFGGASREIARALSGQSLEAPQVLDPGPELAAALSLAGLDADASRYDRMLREAPADIFPGRTGLSPAEHELLFTARSLPEVTGLVLKGMAAVAQKAVSPD